MKSTISQPFGPRLIIAGVAPKTEDDHRLLLSLADSTKKNHKQSAAFLNSNEQVSNRQAKRNTQENTANDRARRGLLSELQELITRLQCMASSQRSTGALALENLSVKQRGRRKLRTELGVEGLRDRRSVYLLQQAQEDKPLAHTLLQLLLLLAIVTTSVTANTINQLSTIQTTTPGQTISPGVTPPPAVVSTTGLVLTPQYEIPTDSSRGNHTVTSELTRPATDDTNRHPDSHTPTEGTEILQKDTTTPSQERNSKKVTPHQHQEPPLSTSPASGTTEAAPTTGAVATDEGSSAAQSEEMFLNSREKRQGSEGSRRVGLHRRLQRGKVL